MFFKRVIADEKQQMESSFEGSGTTETYIQRGEWYENPIYLN